MKKTQHRFDIPRIMEEAKGIEKTRERIDNLEDEIDKRKKEKVESRQLLEMQGLAFGRFLYGWTPEEVLLLLNETSGIVDLVEHSTLFFACLALPEENPIRKYIKQHV